MEGRTLAGVAPGPLNPFPMRVIEPINHLTDETYEQYMDRLFRVTQKPQMALVPIHFLEALGKRLRPRYRSLRAWQFQRKHLVYIST